jgi:hypothetical protein
MHKRAYRREPALTISANFVFSKVARPSKTFKSAQICTNAPLAAANPRPPSAPIFVFSDAAPPSQALKPAQFCPIV